MQGVLDRIMTSHLLTMREIFNILYNVDTVDIVSSDS